jgi:hypothetical protein
VRHGFRHIEAIPSWLSAAVLEPQLSAGAEQRTRVFAQPISLVIRVSSAVQLPMLLAPKLAPVRELSLF